MAYLSESSYGRGRRLSEMLEEQQEPFLLDVYLLEKGHSGSLLASHSATMCWPVNACKKLQKITSHGLRRKRMPQLLQCVLAKFLLNRKAWRKGLNWGNSRVLHLSDAGSKDGGVDCDMISCSGIRKLRELDAGIGWECMEVDDEEQLSPVSVLELHSCEGSPAAQFTDLEEEISTRAIDLKELLELACLPTLLPHFCKSTNHFDEPEKPLLDCAQDARVNFDTAESISQLTFTEISNSRMECYEFRPHIREIAAQIQESIFEDIREDVILELLGFLKCKYLIEVINC